ncbi:MAG: glutamyl-tRNA reductase [Gemmatales bacterium]|nr:glutamyl-tRNA reductase [Gemmatales bacterium]MCS7159314.1 glutamyl-tRNA reductase [Gemmatales bacterium]MDW8174514.1 glutamyl-tRNA reductase [Gemmatales bacterium]MDW8222534.1 glutamyl-tRNA reductase [Gemmatales bacterium]
MNLIVFGANHRTMPMALRERLAVGKERLADYLTALQQQFGCEVVILSTCNRVEVYLARLDGEAPLPRSLDWAEFLQGRLGISASELRPHLYEHREREAVRHLFRVACGLDSLVVGEDQIANQVKSAYEWAQEIGTVGPVLHALFQQARVVSKRVRRETGIAQGKMSVASLGLDYLRQVFASFRDKTVLLLGAGKMGELTLKHLLELRPRRILVCNRSLEKAQGLAHTYRGQVYRWEQLDDALAEADIILSATGASEIVVSRSRLQAVLPRRLGRHLAILDLAVPRDFEPSIAELEEVDLLLNVDDLNRIREEVLKERLKHVPAAEALVQSETDNFLADWNRRRLGPAIARLCQEWERIRLEVQQQCFQQLDGKLAAEDLRVIENAFRLLQNKYLHLPLSALREEAKRGGRLLDALLRLFSSRSGSD